MEKSEIKYDKKTKTLTRKTPFSTSTLEVGKQYENTSPGQNKTVHPVQIEDVIDDMVLVKRIGGTNDGKKQLMSFEQAFRDYGPKELKDHAKALGNPDMHLGIHREPNRSVAFQLLEEQRKTNQLLEKLVSFWDPAATTKHANGVGHK